MPPTAPPERLPLKPPACSLKIVSVKRVEPPPPGAVPRGLFFACRRASRPDRCFELYKIPGHFGQPPLGFFCRSETEAPRCLSCGRPAQSTFPSQRGEGDARVHVDAPSCNTGLCNTVLWPVVETLADAVSHVLAVRGDLWPPQTFAYANERMSFVFKPSLFPNGQKDADLYAIDPRTFDLLVPMHVADRPAAVDPGAALVGREEHFKAATPSVAIKKAFYHEPEIKKECLLCGSGPVTRFGCEVVTISGAKRPQDLLFAIPCCERPCCFEAASILCSRLCATARYVSSNGKPKEFDGRSCDGCGGIFDFPAPGSRAVARANSRGTARRIAR